MRHNLPVATLDNVGKHSGADNAFKPSSSRLHLSALLDNSSTATTASGSLADNQTQAGPHSSSRTPFRANPPAGSPVHQLATTADPNFKARLPQPLLPPRYTRPLRGGYTLTFQRPRLARANLANDKTARANPKTFQLATVFQFSSAPVLAARKAFRTISPQPLRRLDHRAQIHLVGSPPNPKTQPLSLSVRPTYQG